MRRIGELAYLRPDGKTQVTVEYEDGKPRRIAAVVLSTQHKESVETDTLRDDILTHVILPTLPARMLDDNTQY